ncbi:hypothetical protein ACJD0Z_09435 [Flavobacteriaceae bacterium M23B6Z8]
MKINSVHGLRLTVFVFLITSTTVWGQSSYQRYNKVQSLYGRYYSIVANDCNGVNALIRELEAYKNDRTPVPADKAYTVSFKRKVTNPTIADLAEDRIARVAYKFANCVNVNNQREVELYNSVQNIYLNAPRRQSTTPADCQVIKNLIAKLEPYKRYGEAVPAKWAYTVNYPTKKANPSIGDLATDRISRLQQLNAGCNKAPAMSSYVLTNLPGIYNYKHKGRDYQLGIYRSGNVLTASFTKHGYSYPPIFDKAELYVANGVRFSFVLGGSYRVELDVAHNSMGVSAYIYESWEGSSKTSLGVISKPAIDPNNNEISTDGSVKINFQNLTNGVVNVFWVNFQGQEVKYKTLQPGKAYIQPTYNKHQWRVRQNGRLLKTYIANNFKNQRMDIR